MKEWKKNIKYIILTISLIAILPTLLWIVVFNIDTANKENAEKHFRRDKDDILLITEFLINSSRASIIIDSSDVVIIEDEEIKEVINRLLKKEKYYEISKNGSTIQFVIWTKFMDFGSGIVYSANGEETPIVEYLTKLEPLSEDGWYYYESDYNLWQTQN